MMFFRLLSGRDRRLLPDSRVAGPMPWVIAIMMFLTVLSAAAGLGLSQATGHLRSGLAGRITVQIVEGDPQERERQTQMVTRELRRLAGVKDVRRVNTGDLKALLEPWLGSAITADDIPMPNMIDVDLTTATPSRIDAIGEAIRTVAPTARIDAHGQWLAPLDKLIALLKWLAIALVLLMAAATAFIVELAARAALDTHRSTIDVMHLLGATDVQIARLFQRRIAIDALIGGMIGFAAAGLMVLLLAERIEGLGSELIGSVTLAYGAWASLLLLPIAGTALAMVTARMTILNAVGRIL